MVKYAGLKDTFEHGFHDFFHDLLISLQIKVSLTQDCKSIYELFKAQSLRKIIKMYHPSIPKISGWISGLLGFLF